MSTGSDENELVSLLQGCEVGMPLEMRLKICRGLLDLVENQRVRDVDKLPWKIYGFLVDSIRLGWQHPEAHLVKQSQACLTGLIDIPEFEVSVAGDVVDDGFLLQLCDRFHRGVAFERAFLRDTLHWAYANFPQKRCLLRQKIGSVLSHFVRAPSSSFHAAELLQVLRHIIKGFPENLTQVRFVLAIGRKPTRTGMYKLRSSSYVVYYCTTGVISHQLQLSRHVADGIYAYLA